MDMEVNRRKLLKILAASGSAVVASAVIPGKWLKPVVEMGVLPAHAQLSVACTVSTTIDITNNWDEPVYVIYTRCSDRRQVTEGEVTIGPVGGPNTLQIVAEAETYLEMAPVTHEVAGRCAYNLGGACAGMTVIDYTVDLHIEDNLNPGPTGTIVVTSEPPP
jgi:hypothetical protein